MSLRQLVFTGPKACSGKMGRWGDNTAPTFELHKAALGSTGAHKLPGYQKHGCVTVQLASCCKYCDNLGCQFDTPGKKEPQLRNCFHQIGSRAHLWCVFLVANWCRRNRDTVGLWRQAGLGCGRKVAWNLGTNQQAALFRGFCFHSCLKFLPDLEV